MPEATPDQLKQALEFHHSGKATFLQFVQVREANGNNVVWDGAVAVFELKEHPDGAFRAYAWSQESASGKRTFFATLHGGRITGPREAVRASLAETK
jgi:hypothetical protein